MQRPRGNARLANVEEKAFQAYTKESPCIVCGAPGPSIVEHCYGSTVKKNKVLIGHKWVIPLCLECDDIKTNGSPKKLIIKAKRQLKILWDEHACNYSQDRGMIFSDDVYGAIEAYREYVPDEVSKSIMDWGRY